jgi:hypothetical protein
VNKVRLIYAGVAEVIGSQEMSIIALIDEAAEQQVSVVCDMTMANELMMRTGKNPLSHMFLPEVLLQLLSIHADLRLEILVSNLIDGQFITTVEDTNKTLSLPIRISDAILLSVIGHIPLYMESALMHRLCVPYRNKSPRIPLPVNTLTTKMLEEALVKAIDNEEYEQASHLRDEIRRRKTGDSSL